MIIDPIKLVPLVPPKDDLQQKILSSAFAPKDGDIIAITSKVVSIDEGRCIPVDSSSKEELIRRESEWYIEREKLPGFHTITRGALIGGAGIDQSNSNGFYTLYPKDPMYSARELYAWIAEAFSLKTFGLIITDSHSTPLRRGASGFALAWHGFMPLRDYRGTEDIFGRELVVEMANIADGLAAAAVLAMGEGAQQTPVALLRDVPGIEFGDTESKEPFIVPMSEDLFAQFLTSVQWKKGSTN